MNPPVKSVINAVKQPLLRPLLRLFCVNWNQNSTSWAPTFDLIAKANAGVASLAAGIALFTVSFN